MIPHRPTKPRRRAKKHPADAENRGRHKGQHREHALARQPRRAPLRERPPGALRTAEMQDRRAEPGRGERQSPTASATKANQPLPGSSPSGAPSPSNSKSANPAPDAVVKKTIESAGCMSRWLHRARRSARQQPVDPAQQPIGGEPRAAAQPAGGVGGAVARIRPGRGGRYLLTGL